jgi:F-type H+-transporting ATPase subunit epsilon
MTTLRPGVVAVTLASGKTERIFVRGGFADVNAGGLTVLAEQAIPLADLDAEVIAKEIRDAEEDVADAKDETAKANAALKVSQLREVQVELARPGAAGGH